MKIDIRPIRADEIKQARAFVPANYEQANWPSTFAVLDDGVLVGIVGVQKWLVAEPLYISPNLVDKQRVVACACTWLDGFLRVIASENGLPGWYAFVTDEHAAFQKFIERNMPVFPHREKPGVWYYRDLTGAKDGQVKSTEAS